MFSGLSSFDELKEVLVRNNVNGNDIQIFNTEQDFEYKPLKKYNMMNVLNSKFTKLSTGHAVLLVKFTDKLFYYFDPTSVISNEVFEKIFKDKKVYILCNLDQLQDYRKDQSCGWYVVREIFLIELNKLKLKNYLILEYNDGIIKCLKKEIKKDFNYEYNDSARKIEEMKIESQF